MKRLSPRLLPLLLLAPFPAAAIDLNLPLDCNYGQSCFVQNYVDHDTTPKFSDFHCGTLGYDGHTGSDIRVPTLVDMRRGVDVLAAAGGTVLRVRDGMEDVSIRDGDPSTVKEKECGNALVISHGDDWETQYCHLKQGSLVVKPGDKVKTGQKLGQVGLSGETEFPHLHFELRHLKEVIDPFDGTSNQESCTVSPLGSLWKKPLPYIATGLLHAGFNGTKPENPMDLADNYDSNIASGTSPYLLFHIYLMGVEKGDVLTYRIMDSTGKALAEKTETLEKNQAQIIRYIGVKNEGKLHGIFQGDFKLVRPGLDTPLLIAQPTVDLD